VSPSLTLAATVVAFLAGWCAAWPHRRRLRRQLQTATRRLRHDLLTGLPNRTGLTGAHARWVDQHQSLVLLLIDLDQFKPINDTYGHAVGDQLLAAVARPLRELAASHGGIAARLAGDEFALLLPLPRLDYPDLAERALTLISGTRVNTYRVGVTASIGIHTAEHTTPLAQLLRGADIALYHAKRAGGFTHIIYHPGMAMPAQRDHRLREHRWEDTP
jgi:diguanylate cyclase (GGDEF)-like protein